MLRILAEQPAGGANVTIALAGFNVLQTVLMAWLAYRYEQRGRERRVRPSRRG